MTEKAISMEEVVFSVNRTWPIDQSSLHTHEAAAVILSIAEEYPHLRSSIIQIVNEQLRDRICNSDKEFYRSLEVNEIRGAAEGHPWRQRTIDLVIHKYRTQGRPKLIKEIQYDLREAFNSISEEENHTQKIVSDSTLYYWSKEVRRLL